MCLALTLRLASSQSAYVYLIKQDESTLSDGGLDEEHLGLYSRIKKDALICLLYPQVYQHIRAILREGNSQYITGYPDTTNNDLITKRPLT